MVTTRADFWSGTTARARRFKSPLREFLRTESGGAAVLLAATAAALVWVNVDASSYQELWEAVLAIDLDGNRIELTLREWVNSGLMTFFFFVLGLEARREFDLGDFRERRRFVLPLLASVGGMGAAAAIYLAFNLGSSAAEGWGSRCRPTRRSRWDCSRCSAGGLRTACGRSCSRSSSRTTCSRLS
jgi:Na+/H+ antiporter NhaA